MLTTLAGGLGRQGLVVTFDLNPRFTQVVPLGELAEVKVYVLADGSITQFAIEGRSFDPEISAYQPDDGDCTEPEDQLIQTGLDPAVDPTKAFADAGPPGVVEPEDCVPEAAQMAPTGLDPATDPSRAFHAEESPQGRPDGTAEGPQTTQTGLDPAVDPTRVFEDKASTAQRPDGKIPGSQLVPTGTDPAVDPDKEFEDKASGSEDDGDPNCE